MNNEQFQALLRQWRDIEPAGNFEANVRRRIRLAVAPPRQSWLTGLLWRPAFAVAAAVVVSVAVGSSAGIMTAAKSARSTRGELRFMSAGTLAGGYAKLASERAR